MRRLAPVFILFALSPFIAEVLLGATPISRIGGLILVGPFYGCGAILIREIARRRSSGWMRIVLLAAAYAIIEECFCTQTIFNPTLFHAADVGGRWLGVNWVWAQNMLGYHIAWSICIPILLTEILFPARRNEPWLGLFGMSIAAIMFAFSALGIGVVFRHLLSPGFEATHFQFAVAGLLIVALIAFASAWPKSFRLSTNSVPMRPAPSPWLVAIVTFICGMSLFALFVLPPSIRKEKLVVMPMLLQLGFDAVFIGLIRAWSMPSRAWNDLHRLAMIFGALLVNILFGFFAVTASNRIDQIGLGITGVVSLMLLGVYSWRIRRSENRIQIGQR
jgi:hypothetical protein